MSALLTQVLVALTREYEAGGTESATLPFWANFLRILDARGVEVAAAPARARVSRRAMRVLAGGAEKSGLVTTADRVIRPTPAGSRQRADGEAAVAAAESRWRTRFGEPRVTDLRTALVEIVAGLDLEYPHYPIGYGSADVSITGGRGVAQPGQDWRPVPRVGADRNAVTDLPLSALLSQPLVAFAADYESRGVGPLAWASVLRDIPDAGVPFGDLPPGTLLTGNGTSGLERHGVATVDPGRPLKARTVRLTRRGTYIRDAYAPTTAAIEDDWAAKHGADPVTALRSALQAITGELGPGLPHYPVVTWVGGLRESSGE